MRTPNDIQADTQTNITAAIKHNFDVVRADNPNIALFSSFVNGEPTAAIVSISKMRDGSFEIHPLFVAVTPGMKLTDHDGREPEPLYPVHEVHTWEDDGGLAL